MTETINDRPVAPTATPNGTAYPGVFNDRSNGRWYTCVGQSGSVVGVVWTDDATGFGFIPIDTTLSPDVTAAVSNFVVFARVAGESELTAGDAFDASKRFGGYTSASEASGQLTDALETYELLSRGIEFTPSLETDDDDAPIVAAGDDVTPPDDTPVSSMETADLPNGATYPLPEGDYLSVTTDETGQVLELVYSDATGYYLRSADGAWDKLDDDSRDASITDCDVIDVTPAYIPIYDAARANDDVIADSDVEQYRADAS